MLPPIEECVQNESIDNVVSTVADKIPGLPVHNRVDRAVGVAVICQVEGKIGQALWFAEADQFLLGEDVSTRCLGDLQRCHHGLYVSMWIRFNALQNHTTAPVLDTGYKGLRVFCNYDRLSVNATAGVHSWTVSGLLSLLLLL